MRIPALAIVAFLMATPAAGALGVLGVELVDLGNSGGRAIVGVEHDALGSVTQRLVGLGANVLLSDEDLDILVVSSNDLTGLLTSVLSIPGVTYTEKDDATHTAGAQWNGAQWNGAQWNGAQWNGAQWNGNTSSDADPGLLWQWGLTATKAPLAWKAEGTSGASLCILDSGVAWDHPDLESNVDAGHGINLIDPTKSAYDDAGHGTHMAGVAAAQIGNGFGVAGVANADILPVKVLKSDGTGTESDLAIGLAWCANHGAKVALMALSVTDDGPTLRKAIQYAHDHDVLLVASAGNGGCSDCVAYPARDKDVLAVGAVSQTLSRASFSSRGGQVDLAAPGVDILGPFPGDKFVYGSGTSQAAAFVAGAAALVRGAHPELSADAARARLEGHARDIGVPGVDASFGHGLLDVDAALGG
ncbi:MAG TPA: S8 family serine peptidase [Candidatus Thermoplasmatota archaeon]|nr:S8 family serine peptidase [Candidatus Thermoplasmatota archaeon]